MKFKKIVCSLLALGAFCVNAQASVIKINDAVLELEGEVKTINERTYVPFREIAEAIGASVGWDEATRQVSATRGKRQLSFKAGDDFFTLNGEKLDIEGSVENIKGVTYVPLRSFSESFGAEVEWQANTKTISITVARPEEVDSSTEGKFTLSDVEINRADVELKITFPRKDYGSELNRLLSQNSEKKGKEFINRLEGEAKGLKFKVDISVKESYEDRDIISFALKEQVYMGDRKVSSTLCPLTFSKRENTLLSESEIFGPDADLKKDGKNTLINLVNNSDKFYFDSPEIIDSLEEIPYYINSYGRVVYTLGEGIIAPETLGNVEAEGNVQIS